MTRADWLQAALATVVVLALYAYSAPRTVVGEDDGLFILSAYFLGVEHPPGYPLFTWIGHLFTYLPFGSVAYRIHLASAFLGALTCGGLWLAVHFLLSSRLAAWIAALALGASPVFWSQAVIAEVYTLNTFFLVVLLNMGLRLAPPAGRFAASPQWLLPAMALVFGASLSNHYPLMLLVAPAFAILLWPLWRDILRRSLLLFLLVVVGLLPYGWMVLRSLQAVPIVFDGPLETLTEVWFFINRSGYANIDQSASANWLDRVRFFQFFGEQFFLQFAILGTLLAIAGFVLQWRVLGTRVSAFLTLAFAMPSLGLILLLGFDYSGFTRHIFHVYPLPAYVIGALWMGAGFVWLAGRRRLSPRLASGAAAVLVALVLAFGAERNLFVDHGWPTRYAQAILKMLPKNAILFVKGEPDFAPIAYLHMIENARPDITLYQPQGLILGNRLFHPLRTGEEAQSRIIREFISKQTDPVAFTLWLPVGYPLVDRWLFSEVDRSRPDSEKTVVDIPDEFRRFYQEDLAGVQDRNAWIATVQNELRRRYAVLLARSLPEQGALDDRTRRDFEGLSQNFFGASGIAEGLMLNEKGYSPGVVAHYLERMTQLMPPAAAKEHLSRFFYLRGVLRMNDKDHRGAAADLETALSIWPIPNNPAITPLQDLYRARKDERALAALEERVEKLKQPRP